MLTRTARGRAARAWQAEILAMGCLTFLWIASLVLPAYADVGATQPVGDGTAISTPAPVETEAEASQSAGAPAVEESNGAAGQTSVDQDTAPSADTPKLVEGHPRRSRLPLNLAVAGILMIPFDARLSDDWAQPASRSGGFADAFSGPVYRGFLIGSIVGLYALGDDYDKCGAKLALTALVNATIVTSGLKVLTGRERPSSTGNPGHFAGPSLGSGHNSFPSGHTSVAFSVATVLAKRYPKQRWLYYGLATAVGISRVRKAEHYPSEVLVGAAIGIYEGNNAVRLGPNILSHKIKF